MAAIDILVCNAAVNPYYGPLGGISDEQFDKIMASNIKSNLWLCNLAIPHMVARGGGSVIIISSIGGIRGTEVLGAYGISKAADFALARNLACEWGPKNVRVNCVAPGLVKTDFARALWENEEMVARRNAATPLRRIGMPDEIGGVAAFLAGPGRELHHRPGDRGGWRRDDCVNPSRAREAGRVDASASERTGGALQQVTLPRRFAPTSPAFRGGMKTRYFFFWLWSSYLRSSSRATASSCTASGPSTMRMVRVRAYA